MKYLLDTDTCIYIIKKKPAALLNRLFKENISNVGISSITLSELEYGVEKSQYPGKNKLALIEFLAPISVYGYDSNCAKEYGVVRADLERRGKVIGAMDMLIAAHAKALNLILVTNNIREFKNVKGLRIENWV
ncbi:MAG: type II toxin-antitoxin system VapC family toxin [bacterium]